MNRRTRILFACVSLLAAACLALAQPQNNRRAQQATMVLQAMQDSQASAADPLVLIYRKDVQKDLGLDLGPRNKLDNLRDRQQRDLQQARIQNRRNQTAVAKVQAAQREETRKKVDELLAPAQKQRLGELVLQIQGNSVLTQSDIQKKLDLTDEQKQQVQQVKAQRDERLNQLRASIASGETRIQDVQTAYQQIQTDSNAAFGDLLTSTQADLLRQMFGREFKPGS